MDRLGTALKYMLVGAISFWGPDVLLSAWRGTRVQWRLLTLVLPVISLGAYRLISRRGLPKAPSLATCMLAGILFFGPPFMLWTATLKGGGLNALYMKDFAYLPVFMILPPFTFILSGYDQSIFALIIVSVALLVLRLRFERRSSAA